MKSRDVPNTLAHGWGGHGLQSRTFSRMACGEFGGHTGLVTLSGEISLINCAIFCSASADSAILCDYAGSDGWVWRRFVWCFSRTDAKIRQPSAGPNACSWVSFILFSEMFWNSSFFFQIGNAPMIAVCDSASFGFSAQPLSGESHPFFYKNLEIVVISFKEIPNEILNNCSVKHLIHLKLRNRPPLLHLLRLPRTTTSWWKSFPFKDSTVHLNPTRLSRNS